MQIAVNRTKKISPQAASMNDWAKQFFEGDSTDASGARAGVGPRPDISRGKFVLANDHGIGYFATRAVDFVQAWRANRGLAVSSQSKARTDPKL